MPPAPRRRAATLAVLFVAMAVVLPGGALGSSPALAAPAAQPNVFSKTETISRTHLGPNGDVVADTRNFSVSVNQTTALRGQQQVDVAWSGAHPTLGMVTNPNGQNAYLQEYPVVLIECRGNDTPGKPVDPSACWTSFEDERRNETFSTSYPAWRMDRWADPGDRETQVGYPGLPDCTFFGNASRHIPFVAADAQHTTYWPIAGQSTPDACGPTHAPEAVDVQDPEAPPPNTTFAVTHADGTGDAKFEIWTDQENGSLGCSTTVTCSLVVIPIMGISCDLVSSGPSTSDGTVCQATGKNAPNTVVDPNQFTVDEAVTGEYWWAASNWRNRVVVPLSFGTPGNVCDTGDSRAPLDIFGSELMSQATIQWTPAFCLDPARFKFRHVRVGEPQAKSALDGGEAEAALITQAPAGGYQKPTVNAPVGVTGFAVSYVADKLNPNGTLGGEYHDLKLNARLLAKLMAESYVPSLALRDEYAKLPVSNAYKAMAENPIDLSNDPEFQALNPGVGLHNNDAATSATVLSISASSDVIYALTSYINADPQARAWLDGKPDPWGMVVNPGYANIPLPQPTWPLADSYLPGKLIEYGCLNDPTNAELLDSINAVPFLPLVASPVPSLEIVAQKVQFAISNAHTQCSPITKVDDPSQAAGVQMKAVGRQGPGHRLMLGITSLADARFLQLDTAALQTTATVVNPEPKFTDATGRQFVAPTDESLRNAMLLATPDATTNTWTIPYDKLRTTDGTHAYPGTMPVYLSVPTSKLPAGDGPRLAQLIRFAAGPGQTAGLGNGQLPPGYLPMTAGNGLSAMVNYALRAADAVAAQNCQVPKIAGGTTAACPGGGGGNGNSNGGSNAAANPAPVGVPNPGASLSPLPLPSTSPTPAAPRSLGLTAALFSSLARWALPGVLLVGLGASLVGLGTRAGLTAYPRRRGRR